MTATIAINLLLSAVALAAVLGLALWAIRPAGLLPAWRTARTPAGADAAEVTVAGATVVA